MFVDMKMVERRELFQSKNYPASIHADTDAIKIILSAESTPATGDDDKYALAISNRAVGLLLVGAYNAAVSGCNTALALVGTPPLEQPFRGDGGVLLRVKLYARLGRADMKLGHEDATRAFHYAGQRAEVALGLSDDQKDSVAAFRRELSSLKTEAALGRARGCVRQTCSVHADSFVCKC